MDNMEDKLGAILGNPEMMQKIMTMAQSLGSVTPEQEQPQEIKAEESFSPFQNLDLGMLQKLSGAIGKTTIDREQQALLSALEPYLSNNRIRKLENAMRASRLAAFAAQVLRQAGR